MRVSFAADCAVPNGGVQSFTLVRAFGSPIVLVGHIPDRPGGTLNAQADLVLPPRPMLNAATGNRAMCR
jgi:hypothetical protein